MADNVSVEPADDDVDHSTDQSDEKLLKEARERFSLAVEAEGDNRDDAISDLEFSNPNDDIKGQWPRQVRALRERDGRPCLQLDRTDPFVRQVVNNIRESRPAIKVRGVDDQSDPENAKLMNGMIRAIESSSNAESAYDWGAEYAVRMGWGYWAIDTDWEDWDSFDQKIVIRRVQNPFTIYLDPDHDEPDGSDAEWFFEQWFEDKEKAKKDYPVLNKGTIQEWDEFEGTGVSRELWYAKDHLRFVKYWKKTNEKTTLYMLEDGSVTTDLTGMTYQAEQDMPELDVPEGALIAYDDDPDLFKALAVIRERETYEEKVKWYLLGGNEVLDRGDWAGRHLPIVQVIGEELDIEGERYRNGMVRRLKDPQRQYNYWRSAHTEKVALAPQAPFIGPEGAFKNSKWGQANKRNFAYIEYDTDAVAKLGPASIPQRQPGAQVSPGDVHEQQVAADDLHAISGIHQPGLGEPSNERSGRAVWQRRNAGDMSNFHYIDNVARSMRHTGRILVDLIPKIYDTERVVTILEPDGSEKKQRINQEQEDPTGQEPVRDIRMGKYDATVTIGPSYSTQRQEAQSFILEILSQVPQSGPLIADLLAKNSDAAGADEIADRLKALLPPEILEGENPQVAAAIAGLKQQLQMSQQQLQQMGQEYQKMALKLENKQGELAVKMQEIALKRDELRQKTEQEIRELLQKAQHEGDQIMIDAAEVELKYRTDIAGLGVEREKARNASQPE